MATIQPCIQTEYESHFHELSLHCVPKLRGQHLDSLQMHKIVTPPKICGPKQTLLVVSPAVQAETGSRKKSRTPTYKELRRDCQRRR